MPLTDTSSSFVAVLMLTAARAVPAAAIQIANASTSFFIEASLCFPGDFRRVTRLDEYCRWTFKPVRRSSRFRSATSFFKPFQRAALTCECASAPDARRTLPAFDFTDDSMRLGARESSQTAIPIVRSLDQHPEG